MDSQKPGDDAPPIFATLTEALAWAANNPAPDSTVGADPAQPGFTPRVGGVALSKAEALEWVNRPVWLGQPEPAKKTAKGLPVKPAKPGPKSQRTQYDDALDARKDIRRRLVEAPRARRKLAVEVICKAFDEVVGKVPAHKLRSEVTAHLDAAGYEVPTDENLRLALIAGGRWPLRRE